MDQLYEHGAVRLTGTSPSRALAGHYITFEEIVRDTADASVCFLSSYVIDQEWLWPHFANVPRVVAFLDNERSSSRGHDRKTFRTGCGRAHERTLVFPIFPSFPKWGTMHVKFIIIVRPASLRLAISSANLVPYDYDSVQNAVFIQDLPVLPESPPYADQERPNSFKNELYCLLFEHMGLPRKDRAVLDRYDWSRIKAKLVYSVPGLSPASSGNGLAMLRRKVPRLVTAEMIQAVIECQGSSIGSLAASWVSDFYLSALGLSPDEASDEDDTIIKKCRGLAKDRLRIVFPTREYVMTSKAGPGMFGTIFCAEKHRFLVKTLQRAEDPAGESVVEQLAKGARFYRCEYGHGIVERPLHTKLITAFLPPYEDRNAVWMYLGSANITPSAWGSFGRRAGQERHIMISNYELGVLVSLETDGASTLFGGDGKVFPLPYKRPIVEYSPSDSPWIQSDYFSSIEE